MNVVFLTNYYNHHQASFAAAMDELTEHHFYFMETEEMEEERRQLGWGQVQKPSYVLQTYQSETVAAKCRQLILDADVVIWGCHLFGWIMPRLRRHKLTFYYSERIFKDGSRVKNIARMLRYDSHLLRHQNNQYLLCASAYAAEDYARLGLFRGRAYKWGYFPRLRIYTDLDALMDGKDPGSMLWAGRMIEWKHPEMVIELAKGLKQSGCPFSVTMIGTGALQSQIQLQIRQNDLEDCVRLTGALSPREVRNAMEKAQIFLATSDAHEGWGAVVNEAMNSGCAVVASNLMGSVPYLIENGRNGEIFRSEDIKDFNQKVSGLLSDTALCRWLGVNAVHTITQTWNAQTAAERLYEMSTALLVNGQPVRYPDGPCSRADSTVSAENAIKDGK